MQIKFVSSLLLLVTFFSSAMELTTLHESLLQLSKQLQELHNKLEKMLEPPSLPNLGNTCYMNSVIQGFYANTSLNHFLIDKESQYPEESLARKYIEVIKAFQTGSYLDQLQAFATETDTIMQAATAICDVSAQQDAEEFLTQFLLFLTASNSDDVNQFIRYLFEITVQPLYYCSSINRTYAIAPDHGNQLILPVRDPNTGQLLPNNLEALLQAYFTPEQNVSYEPEDLELAINVTGDDIVNISVKDKVLGSEQQVMSVRRSMFLKQNLAGIIQKAKEYYVQKQCIKSVYLTKLPPFLVIAIKRYDIDPIHAAQSYAMQIKVPINLHLSSAMTPAVQGLDETKIPPLLQGDYTLQAALVHLGGLGGGHYVAYVLSGQNWYLCNDERITQVSEQEVLKNSAKAYVYIYKKIGAEEEIKQEQEKTTKSLLALKGIKKKEKRV